MSWRTARMCDNCPFRPDGAIMLEDGRLDEIKDGVALGQPFFCHKTVDYGETAWEHDDDGGASKYRRQGNELECSGALEYRQSPEGIANVETAFARILTSIETPHRGPDVRPRA